MSKTEVAITIALAVVLTILFYKDELDPEIIEAQSRLDFLLDKLKTIMGDSELLVQTIKDLNARDIRLEGKLDKIVENQGSQQVQMTEMRGDIKVLQNDVAYLKGKKTGKPPDEKSPTNFATLSDRGLQLNINWKLLKFLRSAAVAILTSGGALGAWTFFKNYINM